VAKTLQLVHLFIDGVKHTLATSEERGGLRRTTLVYRFNFSQVFAKLQEVLKSFRLFELIYYDPPGFGVPPCINFFPGNWNIVYVLLSKHKRVPFYDNIMTCPNVTL